MTHAAGVEPGFLAKTVTADLRIRSKPGLGAGSEKLEPLLKEGARLRVLAGPVEANGYDWFLVDPRAYDAETGRGYPTGWVAAGKDGEPWLKPLRLDCPSVPTDVKDMRDLASDYWLPCFAGVEIMFDARLEQTGYRCSSPDGLQHAMFGGCAAEFITDLVALNAILRLFVVWGPTVDLSMAAPPAAPPEMWPTVEVTGQFDHPAAISCESDTADDLTELAAEIHQARAVLACRNAFVVTSLRVIAR